MKRIKEHWHLLIYHYCCHLYDSCLDEEQRLRIQKRLDYHYSKLGSAV